MCGQGLPRILCGSSERGCIGIAGPLWPLQGGAVPRIRPRGRPIAVCRFAWIERPMGIQIEAWARLAFLAPRRAWLGLQAEGVGEKRACWILGRAVCLQMGQKVQGAVVQHDRTVRVLGKLRLCQPLPQQGGVPCQLMTLGFFRFVALPMPDQIGGQHAPARGVQWVDDLRPQQAVAGIAM